MRALTILCLCIGAAIVCANVFMCMVWLSLPPSDAAYHEFAALTDPVFLSGEILVGGLIGVISFPFVYFTVRRLRLLTTAAFIFGIVLAEIVVMTPFDRRLGMVGSLVALPLALVVVRFSGWRLFNLVGERSIE